jgi:serine/threonine-protein kinase
MCRAQAELDAVFPPPPGSSQNSSQETLENTPLPLIPGYKVEDLLGRGGMGVVFRARHLRLNRVVALKMTLAGAYAGPLERSRFQREAEAVARLQHTNVVQVYDVGDSDGRPYFTMEYVAGGSLAQKLSGVPQPALEAAALIAALAGAVQVAHQSEIVHRDLKPGNILLMADGTPKISDFGLARRLDGATALTWSGAALGTPSYMAPEQAAGKPDAVGPPADIYSLGAILYEMLTGRPPFRAESAAATVEQVLTRDPVPPSRLNPTVPRDLETICLKCLHKEPGKRYSAADDLAADLGRVLRNEPIRARPTGRMEHLLRWVRRRPAAAGLITAVVLLVSTAGVGALVLSQQQLAAHTRLIQTDKDVRRVIEQAQVKLNAGWPEHDLAKLKEARNDADQAESISRSGGSSPELHQEVEAFREDAARRLEHATKNRALMEAVLDVSGLQDTLPLDQPTLDGQYAAAFRQWGCDVDKTAEAEVVARLRQEPDVVIQELIAGLDGWMIERQQRRRPPEEWRRLFRIADQLDRSDRRRRLRVLLVEGLPPRAAQVAGLVGLGSPWPPLWEQTHGNTWRHLLEVRREIDPTAEPVLTVILLARACNAVGDLKAAEELLSQADTARPGQVVLLSALAELLERQGPSRLGEAIGYYRAARGLRHKLGIALSMALYGVGQAKQAEKILRELIPQQPDFYVYSRLGNALYWQQKYAEAEAAYRKAIALNPRYGGTYSNLGAVLNMQRRHVEAEAAARKAIALEPDYGTSYNTLGVALGNQGRYAEAETVFVKAVALQPDYSTYANLGRALVEQRKYVEAEPVLSKAIALQPNNVEAMTYTNLGRSLVGQQKHAQAEAAFHRAIALEPVMGEPRFFLGFELMQQARFHEAAAALKEAGTLYPAEHPDRKQALQFLEQCQRFLILEARLPAMLRGTEKAANAAEQLEFGDLCIRKRLFAAATRFCAAAFKADPKLTKDVPAAIRYNAACAAALAGRAQGEDADRLDDKQRARLRRQALDWLREDLSWWAKNGAALEKSSTGPRHWQIDPDLAGIRDSDALARLPAEERLLWERLWSDVGALLPRASSPK